MKATLLVCISILLLTIGYSYDFGGDFIVLIVGWLGFLSWIEESLGELNAWVKDKKNTPKT
jgi:hypothetical protein